jgi:hypothetical protein
VAGMRRVACRLLDLAFIGAACSGYLGLVLLPERGNWIGGLALAAMLATLVGVGTAAMLLVQCLVFLLRGRTLGMAVTGLVATKGRRWLALLVAPLVLGVLLVVPYLAISALRHADLLGESAARVLQIVAIVAAPALDLIFLVGARRGTLSDLLSGQHVERDPAHDGTRASFAARFNLIDWIVAAVIGAPVVTILGAPPIMGLALGGLLGLSAFGALELALLRKTGVALGGRAWARPGDASPE